MANSIWIFSGTWSCTRNCSEQLWNISRFQTSHQITAYTNLKWPPLNRFTCHSYFDLMWLPPVLGCCSFVSFHFCIESNNWGRWRNTCEEIWLFPWARQPLKQTLNKVWLISYKSGVVRCISFRQLWYKGLIVLLGIRLGKNTSVTA